MTLVHADAKRPVESLYILHRANRTSKLGTGRRQYGQIGSVLVSGNCPPSYSSPKPAVCSKQEVSDNVDLGEGWVVRFPETYIDPPNYYASSSGSKRLNNVM